MKPEVDDPISGVCSKLVAFSLIRPQKFLLVFCFFLFRDITLLPFFLPFLLARVLFGAFSDCLVVLCRALFLLRVVT